MSRKRQQFCSRGHDTHVTGRMKSYGCQVCHDEYYLKRYKATGKHRERAWRDAGVAFTYEEYKRILAAQDFVCAICKKVNENGHALSLDHDHKTNEPRGLLCTHCNTLLGQADDSIAQLEAAIKYLQKYGDDL